MKITARLKVVADSVKKGYYTADIGTDHAYIPIYLIKTGMCDMAIATDIRKGPLERAKRNVCMYGLEDKIDVRQGSGLAPLSCNEVDCAVIAGMGGRLICDMLETDRVKAESIGCFVFQPIQCPELLREYLYNNKYHILDEKLVKEDNKLYEVIVAEHGSDHVEDEIYYEIGKKLIDKKDPLAYEFIHKKIGILKKVIAETEHTNSGNARLRVAECACRIKKYEEVLRCLQDARI